MSKSAHEQSFYCSQIQRFYCIQIFDHASVSRILGLAWFQLRKWPPMPAKMKIVFFVSQFFEKNNVSCNHVRNRIIPAKMIHINTKF